MKLPAFLFLASCKQAWTPLSSDCEQNASPVSEDWGGLGEDDLLAPLLAPMPAGVVWRTSADGESAALAVQAVRADEPAEIVTWHGGGECDLRLPELHVPVSFEVDVGDGLASGTLEGSFWADEDDRTVQVSARGPAELSEDWQALARRALHAGGPVVYELMLTRAWAPGVGELHVTGATDSAVAPVHVSGSVWSGVWYDEPLPDGSQ